MKIFVIARGYPSEKFPQWGCFEKDQAEALAANGHEVVMVSVDTRFRIHPRKHGFKVQRKNGVHSVNLCLLPSAAVGLLGKRIRESFEEWQLRFAYQYAERLFGRPDVLYSHYLFITHRALTLKRRFNLPLVAVEHWSYVNHPSLTQQVRRLGETTYPYLDGLIAVASSLHDAIQHHFGIQSTVVHNLFGQEFKYVYEKKKGECVHFIASGSLIQRKGFDLLINALSQSNLPLDKWDLTIIGEGEARNELESLINKFNLRKQVHLVGQQNKPTIAEMLRQSDIFVLSSRNENFSVAVLEALACGLPVIASLCGGIRECVDEHNGVLFPVDDEAALIDALRHMYLHYKEYDRQYIADDCQKRFGAETIARQLTEVFERAITNS